MDRDLAMRVVAERLESLDRIWDLVLGAESEGQGFVPVSAIRAALTKAVERGEVLQCDHEDLACPPETCDWSSHEGRDG